MKKVLTITILVLLTVGLFVSCNGNAVETVFDTSYKVQADGSWKMGNKVYEPSTKPYILVLPKTLNIEKDVQLADLQAGLMTLDEIRPSQTAVKIGNATVQLMHDNLGNEYYEYINKGDESQAQQIFMRTTDNDFTETILLKAPYDEFSHYGSLNVATVDDVAPESYYEYGRVRKIILSIGHLVAKQQSEIDVIIVNSNDTSKVSVDVETTKVIGIIAPEGVAIRKPASVVTAEPNEKKFLASDGNFYENFAAIPSAVEKIILLNNIDDALESDKSVTFDLSGNTVSGAITVQAGHTLTLTCSEGKGKVEQQPTVNGTLIIEGGNYKFDPSKYIDEDSYESKKVDGTDYYRVTKKASSGDSETQHKGICFTAEEEGAAVKLQKNGSPNDVKIVYSTDGINYQDYTFGEEISAPNIGDKVYFKAKDRNETFSKGGQDFYQFHILNLKKMSCEGNVMYLLNSTGKRMDVPAHAFEGLFMACTLLTSAPSLPATTLAENCYSSMFSGCSNLNSVTMLATDVSAASCLDNWLNNTASTGTLYVASGMKATLDSDTYRPSGWTVVEFVTTVVFEKPSNLGSITINRDNSANIQYVSDYTVDYTEETMSFGGYKFYKDQESTPTPIESFDDLIELNSIFYHLSSGWYECVKVQAPTWGVVGSFASSGSAWENDVVMTETEPNVFVSPVITLTESDRFKLRFGAGWDINYGVVENSYGSDRYSVIELSKPINAISGGLNMAISADGDYIITLDLNNTPTITVTPVTFKAVYDYSTEGQNTLTFYYDAVDHSGEGITVYEDGTTYYLFDDTKSNGAKWGYNGNRGDIKSVVIDASVAGYKSLTSTAYMFQSMKTATSISGAEYLDVSNVTDMSYMFQNFGGGSNGNPTTLNVVPDVSEWNTGNVTNMTGMFESYGNFSNSLEKVPDVSNWNTGNVTNMSFMFQKYGHESQNFNAVPDVSKWNTGNVTDMSSIFCEYGHKSTSLGTVPDVSGWNTSKVENMNKMFNAYGYTSTALNTVPDVSNWNTGNVTNMSGMFNGYGYKSTALNTVPDVSNWNTGKVTNMTNMFNEYGYTSTALDTVPDVSKWNTASVKSMNDMFKSYGNNSTALAAVPVVSKWDTANVTTMADMFQNFGKGSVDFVLDLSGWDLSEITGTDGVNVFNFNPKTFDVKIPAMTGEKPNESDKWYYGDGTNFITPPTGKTFTPMVSVTFVNPEGDVISTMPATQYIQKGSKATKPSDPTDNTPGNSGFHTLAGWYKTKDATTGELSDKWDFNNVVTENITLYAQWQTTIEKIIGKAAAPFPFKNIEESTTNPQYVKDETTWVGGTDQICYGAFYSNTGNKTIFVHGPTRCEEAFYSKNCLKTGIAYKNGGSQGIYTFYIEEGVFTKMVFKANNPSSTSRYCDGTYTPPKK